MTTLPTSDPVFIGLDLGGTTLKAALVAATGEILYETRFDTEQERADLLYAQIVEAALALRDHPQAGGRVAGVGVGVPGLVNRKTNRIEVLTNLPELSDMDLIGELSAALGLPVLLDNDANAAAYAELQVGAARGRPAKATRWPRS